MNIVLIGMRGSGKSTVAKLLAKKLAKHFYDMDSLLVKKVGMALPEFVNKYDWELFRDKESEIADEISSMADAVIATGGGVILRQKNVDALKKNGTFVFLKTSVEQMLKRIGNAKNRPSLTSKKSLKEEIEQVWKERKSLYEQAADVTIDTDNKTLDEIIEEIIKKL